ncbi:lipid asymmetry maintenance protein MlaB [Thalassotalea aquiviva]|uniref:STAS domain-containing protein n=1 Tax=Thalassotalea aquiviva TaxID=3242415 RepID=UPI00352BCA58
MANQFSVSVIDDGQLAIVGELSQHSIIGKQNKYFQEVIDNPNPVIDLSSINKIDTAGLAWLICLNEYALNNQISLTYSQPPQELVKLAKLSQVYDFLPWQ